MAAASCARAAAAAALRRTRAAAAPTRGLSTSSFAPSSRGTGAALRAAAARGLAGSAGGGGASKPPAPRVVRFQDETGTEHFGTFTDVTESACRIARRHPETGKMGLTDEVVGVDIILPPVDPPAIYCIGLNYVDHAAEVKMEMPRTPIVFMKPVTSLTGHNGAIIIPAVASDPPEVDYEAELAVVIGREVKNVREEDAMQYVLGYTIANDVTARRWQGKRGGGQWIRGKGFDTFLPLGPYLVPKSDVPDPHNLKIRTTVNGDTVQDSTTAAMFFKIPQLISFLSQGTTLLPGTVICTGTPAGVGYTRGVYLAKGDVVNITIEGIGMLHNTVAQDLGNGFLEH